MTNLVIKDLQRGETLDAAVLGTVAGGYLPGQNCGPVICETPYPPAFEMPDIQRMVADYIENALPQPQQDPYAPGGPLQGPY